MTLESYKNIENDGRVSEIVICDDASSQDVFDRLIQSVFDGEHPKVRLYQNQENLDCYRNKANAVGRASNQWCILFDSDNVLRVNYLDRLFDIKNWRPDTVYCPVFAEPNFDYRNFAGVTITKENVGQYLDKPMFLTALNTMNFFVNKESFLSVWDGTVDPVTSDSIYFNYCWLKSGRKIHFVDGLQYYHRVHPGSHYQNNNHKTGFFAIDVENKIRQLS